jgi:hypothetical protein
MTRTPGSEGPDAERDTHLLAALRHAPDAALEPPTSLSTRILAHASAATRGGADGTPRSWRHTLADWLAPRAPWAAAFGTIAAATLVGVLWSSRQPPADEDGALQPSKLGDAAATLAERATSKPSAPMPQAPEPPAAATLPKVADAPVPAITRNATPAPPPAQATAEPAPREQRLRKVSPEAQNNAALADQTSLRQSRGAAFAAAADPSTRLDAALRSAAPDAAVWRHAGRVHAHGGEQRLWWSQVGDATQGRWLAVSEMRGDLPPAWMVLSIGGERTAAFWFVGDVLWLRDRAGVWRVPVSAEQRRAWEAAPQRW